MCVHLRIFFFFFSSRRRHTRLQGDWSSDVCSSDLELDDGALGLDALERLLERLGLDLERLGVPPVAVDHGGDPAPEARPARAPPARCLPRAGRERYDFSHTLSVVRYPLFLQSNNELTHWFECSY